MELLKTHKLNKSESKDQISHKIIFINFYKNYTFDDNLILMKNLDRVKIISYLIQILF